MNDKTSHLPWNKPALSVSIRVLHGIAMMATDSRGSSSAERAERAERSRRSDPLVPLEMERTGATWEFHHQPCGDFEWDVHWDYFGVIS